MSHFVEPAQRSGGEGHDDGAVADDVAEIKRMFVSPKARNSGVATSLLAALEASARESGMKRMILETGMAQPEAMDAGVTVATGRDPGGRKLPVAADPAAGRPGTQLVVEGSFGTKSARLKADSSRVRLFETNGLKVSAALRAEGKKTIVVLSTDPWAIVGLDGISAGKTPVDVPDLETRAVQVELRRPSSEPVTFVLTMRKGVP